VHLKICSDDIKVRDFVFPVVTTTTGQSGIDLTGYMGTAFLIGTRGFALTAAHVLDEAVESTQWGGMFYDRAQAGQFVPCTSFERHPTEDVAVLKIANYSPSFFGPPSALPNASLEYEGWGYPSDAAEWVGGVVVPDLVYHRGYVRRRFSKAVQGLIGSRFLELSEPIFPGASGGPVVTRRRLPGNRWELIGVFAGVLARPYNHDPNLVSTVGYGTCLSAVTDWVPQILGHSLAVELGSL
jgi:S1-C subfamily serine protease